MLDFVKQFEYVEELDKYFEELKAYKPLSRKREMELAIAYKNGDEKAFEELITHNLRFVVLMAKKYRKVTDVSFADLISEGNIGLMKAAQKFDPYKGIKFCSYAVWWIRASINECIDRYKERFEYNTVDDHELTNITDNLTVKTHTLDNYESQLNTYHSRRTAVDDIIQVLEEREMKVIMMFFGLEGDGKEKNLDEISQELSITKERVRQIKDGALVKLKCKALTSSELECYRSLV